MKSEDPVASNPEAAHYLQNGPPLLAKPYLELPLGSIQPKGWLLTQLNSMKTGLTGRLDTIYPEVVGARNGWLGGDGDGWERGPYWIDGLLPLAYIPDLIDDHFLINVRIAVLEQQGIQLRGFGGPGLDIIEADGNAEQGLGLGVNLIIFNNITSCAELSRSGGSAPTPTLLHLVEMGVI